MFFFSIITCDRWDKFSSWYYLARDEVIAPHRRVLLEGEAIAAMGDKLIRIGMQHEGMLESDGGGGCDQSDFLVRKIPKKRCKKKAVQISRLFFLWNLVFS